MKSFHGKYWSEHIRERICPRFRQFGEIVDRQGQRVLERAEAEFLAVARVQQHEPAAIVVMTSFDPALQCRRGDRRCALAFL